MPKITCFQHIDCEGPGSLGEILKAKGIEIQVVQPRKGETAPDSLGDGLLILGGPMGAYEEALYTWMAGERAVIQKALEARLPILGLCLGSQLLAKAAGAQVFRGAQPEVGWAPVHLTPKGLNDPLFEGVPETFTAFHWHSDTFTLPTGSEHLAWSDLYRNQAFRIGKNAYGLQFHLEVTKEMAADWMQKYARELTHQGGVITPERITDHLEENIASIRKLADRVFSKFASLL
jgi:GMP synthase (glutamine-hydrolysing)